MSRSIGDGRFKRCGVSCVPDVMRCTLTDNDRYSIGLVSRAPFISQFQTDDIRPEKFLSDDVAVRTSVQCL